MWRCWRMGVLFAVALGCCAVESVAQIRVELKDHTSFAGKAVELETVGRVASRKAREGDSHLIIVMVEEAGVVRHFASRLNILRMTDDLESLAPSEKFTVDQVSRTREEVIAQVGQAMEITPFDPVHGQRRVTLMSTTPGSTRPAKPLVVIQGISEITPKYVKVRGLTHVWEFGLPTTSLSIETIDSLIRKKLDPKDPGDRLMVARFYMLAQVYPMAQRELEAIAQEFPSQKETVEKSILEMRQLMARFVLSELKARRDAGQYEFAYQLAKQFPTNDISGSILLDLRDLLAQYEAERQQMEDIRGSLGDLQAKLPKAQAEIVAPYRSIMSDGLHPSTLPRLSAYQQLARAENLTADQKLALALSGWVAGAESSITQLDTAINYWRARHLILDYLRAETDVERDGNLADIRRLEGIGPEQIEQLIRFMPPPISTPGAVPGQPIRIEVPGAGGDAPTISYVAVLPPEYAPGREYPVLIAMHPPGLGLEETSRWWAGNGLRMGPAQRFGYIVLVPEYADATQRKYDYSAEAQQAVLTTLHDAQRRFDIDADRVFLAGHGMGADAVYDIGFSHPDLFAGLLPISGVCEKTANFYWRNSRDLPVYAISGELDRDILAINAVNFDRMMQEQHPLIYSEYIGRGHEDFHTEANRWFEWMSHQRRVAEPKEFDMESLRPSENSFWWWSFSEFPRNFGNTAWNSKNPRPGVRVKAKGRVLPGANVITLDGAARRHVVWLSPRLVSFDERLEIRVQGGRKFYDIPRPEIGTMLEDYRLRCDRKHVAWMKVEL